MIDPHPVMDLAFQVVDNLILTIGVPTIGYFALRKLHIDTQSALGQRVMTVATNAAALGLAKAQAAADASATPIDIRSAAVEHGVAYLNQAISQKTLTAARITVPLDAMIEAQVAKLQLAPTPTGAAAPAVVQSITAPDGAAAAIAANSAPAPGLGWQP